MWTMLSSRENRKILRVAAVHHRTLDLAEIPSETILQESPPFRAFPRYPGAL